MVVNIINRFRVSQLIAGIVISLDIDISSFFHRHLGYRVSGYPHRNIQIHAESQDKQQGGIHPGFIPFMPPVESQGVRNEGQNDQHKLGAESIAGGERLPDDSNDIIFASPSAIR